MKCIVYTRPDGGVSVCTPSGTAMRYMTHGGGRWDGYDPGFVDRQIAKQAEEVGELNARRFVMAMQRGGCTDAEAHEIMRDRFCAHLGTGIELWEAADVPTDRWFRNAWVRSHNGGPIDISLQLAKPIQFQRIRAAAKLQVATLDSDPVEIDWKQVRASIKSASDLTELRRVWPL